MWLALMTHWLHHLLHLPRTQEGFAGVHFGALRVVDDAARQLTLRNTGRYEVAYRFAISGQGMLMKFQHSM